MSYRERTAWLTLGAMAVAYSIYFTLLHARFDLEAPGGPPVLSMLLLFGIIAGIQGAVVLIGYGILGSRARAAGEIAPDERDRSIARRGATVAYYVLMAEMILVAVIMPFTEPPWKIVNTGLLAIVIAECVRDLLVIHSYRRGWHG